MPNKTIKKLLIIMTFLLCGLLYSCSAPKGSQEITFSREDNATKNENDSYNASDAIKESTKGQSIYVDISGEVINPGVYEVEEGARIYRVIELAGGFTEQAVIDYVNRAKVVSDSEKIVIPSKEDIANGIISMDTSNQEHVKEKNNLVNLNTSTKEELMTLPGIGESKANSIIDYRENIGKFTCIEDIMKISGIKEAAFAKIKDNIKV